MMQAIILAAGQGSRLEQYNNGKPKALIKLDKARLINYQISIFRYFGIKDICVVIGYEGDMIRSVIGNHCHYINNARYAETNSLYSLWLADLLITDASSVANEYTLLNRPIVFLDVLELIKVTKEKLALIDSESWGRRGGLLVERPEEVVGVVAKSLAEPEGLAFFYLSKFLIEYIFY